MAITIQVQCHYVGLGWRQVDKKQDLLLEGVDVFRFFASSVAGN